MKIQILLEDGETPESAREILEKSFGVTKPKVANCIDHVEQYADPLAEEHVAEVNERVKSLFVQMFSQIGAVVATAK